MIFLNHLQVNHDFRKNNSAYVDIEHPRWGAIMGVVTTRHIKAGEELFTYYRLFKTDIIPYDYPWYWELKEKTENAEKEQTENKLLGKDTNISHNETI